ncbi:MAG: hypothetical protein AAF689_15085 [Pseudomonadota bacterium]
MTTPRAKTIHTPPPVPKLNLHIPNLAGGGYAPLQFSGETADGRAIYGRYRGGYLSVTADMGTPTQDLLLEVNLGPALDGYISHPQCCQLTGITGPGPWRDPEESADYDLSGATSFYRLRLDSTAATARQLLADLINAVGADRGRQMQPSGLMPLKSAEETTALEVRFDLSPQGFDAARLTDFARYPKTAQPGHLVLSLSYPSFGRAALPLNGIRPIIHRSRDYAPVRVAGETQTVLHNWLWLKAEFATGDPWALSLLGTIDALALKRFPEIQIGRFDLDTDAQTDEPSIDAQIDPEVLAWLRGGHRRVLQLSRDNTGWRPVD